MCGSFVAQVELACFNIRSQCLLVKDMHDRLNPNIRRRDLPRVLAAGAGAAAASAAPLWLEEQLAKGRAAPRQKLPSATPAE